LKILTGDQILHAERRSLRKETGHDRDRTSRPQAASLKAKAAAQGLTLKAWLGKLAEEPSAATPRKSPKTGRGMLAKYGPAPSAEEIDENREDRFRGFAQDS
jgi:hypothetical protein